MCCPVASGSASKHQRGHPRSSLKTQEIVLKQKTLYRWTFLIYNPSQEKDVLQYLDKNNKGGPKIRDTLYFESF